MPSWPLRPSTRRWTALLATDPAHELAVAKRLLPVAREVLAVPGAEGAAELLELLDRLAPPRRTEVLCPPETSPELIAWLVDHAFTVYDAAAAPQRSVLVLDRRLGWRLAPWEPLEAAFQTACRLLWTRLGYYTVRSGTVGEVHPENRLFTLAGQALWVNTGYRNLSLPQPGDQVRVLGLFSFVGTTQPILHALQIEPAPPIDPPGVLES